MADKGNPSTQNMVVGGGSKGSLFSVRRLRSLSRKKLLLGLAVFVLVLVAVVSAVVLWGANKPTQPTPKHISFAESVQRDINGANQELASAKTPAQKAKAYADLSNAYVNKKGGQNDAVKYARKMVEVQPTADSYSQLAFALDHAGQYRASADAYKKAAALLSKSGVTDDGRSGLSNYTTAAAQEEAKL